MNHRNWVRVARRSLLLSTAIASVASAQSVATLTGSLRDSSGSAVALAQLSLGSVRAVSDSGGRFLLSGLGAGQAILSIRRLGFEPLDYPLKLVAGRIDSLHLVLVMVPGHLPGLTTEADALERSKLADFYRHREIGNGVFFNRKEIEAKRVVRISDVLRRVPGMRIMTDRNGRAQLRSTRGNCLPDFWVDGQRAAFLAVDDLPLGDVEAMEIYRGASGLPPEFNNRFGNPSCGAIVIWTRLPG